MRAQGNTIAFGLSVSIGQNLMRRLLFQILMQPFQPASSGIIHMPLSEFAEPGIRHAGIDRYSWPLAFSSQQFRLDCRN